MIRLILQAIRCKHCSPIIFDGFSLMLYFLRLRNTFARLSRQWRSEGNWRPGANLNFAPPPKKKILKNDNKMYSTTDHVYNHIDVAYMYILQLLT